MMRRPLIFPFAIFVLGFSIFRPAREWLVRFNGIGPTKIGMTLQQLNAALHENFSLPKDREEQECFYVHSSRHPSVSFMILDGRFVRLDVDERGTLTSDGIQIGNTEDDAKRVYKDKLKTTPHAYTGPEGHYLTVLSGDKAYGIRFETDQGRIKRFYAGRADAIQLVEGCE